MRLSQLNAAGKRKVEIVIILLKPENKVFILDSFKLLEKELILSTPAIIIYETRNSEKYIPRVQSNLSTLLSLSYQTCNKV